MCRLRLAYDGACLNGEQHRYGCREVAHEDDHPGCALVHGWKDPIEADIDEYGLVELMDGHHRTTAAAYLGHRTILVQASGFIDQMEQFEEEARALA